MIDDLPSNFVPRPEKYERLIGLLLNREHEEPVAITAALRCAGGYGKTTLAKAICHDERVQEAFDDGILWVTLGERPGDPVSRVNDWIHVLTGRPSEFATIEAAKARLAELLADRELLVVVDDMWNAADLRPFLQGGSYCARLITTRNRDTLPGDSQTVDLDAMRPSEAVQLLSGGLPPELASSVKKRKALEALAARLGEWPLLLEFVNRALRQKTNSSPAGDGLLGYHVPLR